MLAKAGIDVRAALRRSRTPPSLESLSPGARGAIKQIEHGQTDITVRSRKEAEEVLTRFPDLVDTGDWGFDMINEGPIRNAPLSRQSTTRDGGVISAPGRDDSETPSAIDAIGFEIIVIDGEDRAQRFTLGEVNERRIREVHWPIAVA